MHSTKVAGVLDKREGRNANCASFSYHDTDFWAKSAGIRQERGHFFNGKPRFDICSHSKTISHGFSTYDGENRHER